ncbi:MAG: T9SS type A sorting domain-containing protein [Chlorobi bacterium]|nr:T9SS type A sorting domain-containing protein [Chlorobiota bacterium]
MKRIIYIIQLSIILTNIGFAQWNSKWNSSDISSVNVSGWLKFETNLDKGGERFYIVDASKFSIMTNEYSETPQYTYTFTSEEVASGNLIYSLGYDLTGDNYVEFYILITEGTTDQYRQSFKIIDITNGNTVFEKSNSVYFYTYPVVWDIDNDGILECSFARYDYPNFINYVYEVYSTGVVAGAEGSLPVNLNFELKQNYPNPFNPATTIEYTLNKPGYVSIDIYNIKGELVDNVYSGFRKEGTYKEVWNGESRIGNKVSSGTYFYQISQEGKKITKKMLLLK